MRPRAASTTILLLWVAVAAARAGETDPPQTIEILREPAQADRYGRWEFDFHAGGVPAFDPRGERLAMEIAAPDGRVWRIPAFRTQAAVPDEHTGFWKPVDRSAPHWRIRFAPTQKGIHRARLLWTSDPRKTKTEELWTGSFRSVEAGGTGFLHPPRRGGQYLRRSDGEGWFAIGFNVCWPEPGTGVAGYVKYLDRLAEAGCNYTRLWLCTWGFHIETPAPYEYDLVQAAQLDAVFEAADERGIAIKLCLYNFHDLRAFPEKGPYFAPRGPCETRKDFFTSPAARDLTAAKLRYLVARYGAYTSLFGWELFNEMNYTLDSDDRTRLVRRQSDPGAELQRAWTREVADALAALDPYDHLITTSLGQNIVWDALWQQRGMDIAQIHSYIRRPERITMDQQRDAAALALYARSRLEATEKPVLLSECGYLGIGEDNRQNEADPEGIALHNFLWAGALGGHTGSPMLWWWDTYLEPNNLYYHYDALARFLDGVDWSRPKQVLRTEADPEVRVLGLRDARWAGLWLQNRDSTWYKRIVEEREPEELDDILVFLDGFPPGRYKIAWVDTRTGTVVADRSQDAPDGSLRLEAPGFRTDIAARVRWVAAPGQKDAGKRKID
jgi:hypothetical protein